MYHFPTGIFCYHFVTLVLYSLFGNGALEQVVDMIPAYPQILQYICSINKDTVLSNYSVIIKVRKFSSDTLSNL